MGELLGAAQWQGIGVLVTVAITLLTWRQARQSRQHDVSERTPPASGSNGGALLDHRPKPSPSVASRLGGALLVLVVSYALVAGIWAVLAFVLKYPPQLVITSSFVMFAAPPGFLALVMRWPFVGGFLGGAVPLSLYTLYHFQEWTRDTQDSSSPLAWFVVCFLFGGMIGALTAGPTVRAAHSYGVPLPRNYRQAQPVGA